MEGKLTTDEILPEAPTEPYNGPATLQTFENCPVCREMTVGTMGRYLRLHMEDVPIGPGTRYGDFVLSLMNGGFLGKSFCIHGPTLTLRLDPEFLSAATDLILTRSMDIDCGWAKTILERANPILGVDVAS